MDDLEQLATDFDFSDVEVAYHFLKNNEKESNLANIVRLLNGEEIVPLRKKPISLSQVRMAEDQDKGAYPKYTRSEEGKKSHGPGQTKEIGPLEKKLQLKRAEELKKQGKI